MDYRPNNRLRDKHRNQRIKDTWFVISWIDDTMRAGDVMAQDSGDVLDLRPNDKCLGTFNGKLYPACVEAVGKFIFSAWYIHVANPTIVI